MRFFCSHKRCALLLAMLAVAGLGSLTSWAQGRHEQLLLSAPSSPIVTSNISDNLNPGLERLNPSPSSFKQVQDDLFRPLANSFKSVDSMQGVMALPQPQSLRPRMSRHDRELLDQRKNWAFTDLKELYPETSPEDMLGVKQTVGVGQDKLNVTLIQKYYESLGQKPPQGDTKPGQDNDPTGTKQFSFTNGLQFLTKSFPASDQFTKILFSGGPEAFVSDKNPNSDDSSAAIAAAEELRAEQKRLADFRQMLDPSQHAVGSLNGLTPTSPGDVMRNATIAEPYRSSISPMLGMVDPTVAALHSHVNDDPTAFRLGMPNPPKWSPPPKPAKTMQQMLDPFAGNMMKPKF